jgi:hypothetical protein
MGRARVRHLPGKIRPVSETDHVVNLAGAAVA